MAGFGDEWRLHHQGGPAGYEAREYLATPSSEDEVHEGQVFAWNPSITGTKMEDSVLVGADENVVLTAIDGWPTIPVEIGRIYKRPQFWKCKSAPSRSVRTPRAGNCDPHGMQTERDTLLCRTSIGSHTACPTRWFEIAWHTSPLAFKISCRDSTYFLSRPAFTTSK